MINSMFKAIFLVMVISSAVLPVCQEPKPDLRSIEHHFVELGIREERIHIQNEEEWIRFWRRFDNSAPPPVAFEKCDLLIFLMGTQISGGFSVHIKDVRATDHLTQVGVLLCRPPRNSAQVAEVTSPFDIKLIPKARGTITWLVQEGQTGQGQCS